MPHRLHKPGLFITATDTGVGKTVVTCAIAAMLRRQQPSWRIGVAKPMASGCRREREGLVHEDAEALAHFADCRLPLDVIAPARFAAPLAPAVAAAEARQRIDTDGIWNALARIDDASDAVLVEGVGGVLVPIDPEDPKRTVLDFAAELGLPVLVVCRAGLGTLNHTALTVGALKRAGCRVAGLVINGFVADDPSRAIPHADESMATNRAWLQKMNRVPTLATVPACDPGAVAPQAGRLPGDLLEALAATRWPDVLGYAAPV